MKTEIKLALSCVDQLSARMQTFSNHDLALLLLSQEYYTQSNLTPQRAIRGLLL